MSFREIFVFRKGEQGKMIPDGTRIIEDPRSTDFSEAENEEEGGLGFPETVNVSSEEVSDISPEQQNHQYEKAAATKNELKHGLSRRDYISTAGRDAMGGAAVDMEGKKKKRGGRPSGTPLYKTAEQTEGAKRREREEAEAMSAMIAPDEMPYALEDWGDDDRPGKTFGQKKIKQTEAEKAETAADKHSASEALKNAFTEESFSDDRVDKLDKAA